MNQTRRMLRYFLMYDKERDTLCPIQRMDGKLCIHTYDSGGDIYWTIGDDHVYYNYAEALEKAIELEKRFPDRKMLVLAFRHDESDWVRAVTIEDNVVVNRLGYGIFIRKAVNDT